MDVPRLTVRYATPADFVQAFETEIESGGLLVRQAGVPAGTRECVLELDVAGQTVSVRAQVLAVRSAAVALGFEDVPAELSLLAESLREAAAASGAAAGAEEEAAGAARPAAGETPLADRLGTMTLGQKIQLAMNTSEREARIALLRDAHKAVHVHVLRNPRTTLEEAQFAARLGALAPEAIKFIAEHREWGKNVSIVTALVRNQATPVPIALALLPKVQQSELKAIARGGGRPAIVQAARKLVIG